MSVWASGTHPGPLGPQPSRRVPVILVSGIQVSAMLTACMSLQFGLPEAVAVRHTIDPERRTPTRVVSDLTAIIESDRTDLTHMCLSCAIRDDIVPTLNKLAADGRWRSIIACLPIAVAAVQVCWAYAEAPPTSANVFIAAAMTALDGATVAQDLLGDAGSRSDGSLPLRATAEASPKCPAPWWSTQTSSASLNRPIQMSTHSWLHSRVPAP